MNSSEIRNKFLKFFEARGHTILSSASLVPENDPTVLFNTAGMQPLVPYLLGEKHPAGSRLTSSQKCLRTGDIDEVGDFTHHTFFEMLGNWSLGDYFKTESLQMSFEFLTSADGLNLDKERLAVSVFSGDKDAPFDDEAYKIWKDLGISEARIARLPKKNNWWGPAGQTGPCGPCSEIFYWSGDIKDIPVEFNDDHDSWVEIWNNVFMAYNKTVTSDFEPLAQKNVDTGMGLERITAVLNQVPDNYQTDLFFDIIKKLEELSGRKYKTEAESDRLIRIIADHLKAATFIIGDNKGITPANNDQGYIVRRLIRRAIRLARQLGIKIEAWTTKIAEIVINNYQEVYPELKNNHDFIISELDKEEAKFEKTLENGLKEFENSAGANQTISGAEAFLLFQSYGFPLEITLELAQEKGISVDVAGFEVEFKKHQDLSRTAAAGKFKGGLADGGIETTRLHTAAHLLLAALRKVLNEGVSQRGSNITSERLRFDFSYGEKMTEDQIKAVEGLVNNEINKKLTVVCEEMSLVKAKAEGATGVFTSKYGEQVKVYKIGLGDKFFSKEICGISDFDWCRSLSAAIFGCTKFS